LTEDATDASGSAAERPAGVASIQNRRRLVTMA
jgi:hypothetical protein